MPITSLFTKEESETPEVTKTPEIKKAPEVPANTKSQDAIKRNRRLRMLGYR